MKNLLIGLDGLLVTDPTNIRYLTGFVSIAPDEREAYLLITKQNPYLFTHSLYVEQARKLPVAVIEISRDHPFAASLAKVAKQQKLTRVGFEETDVTVFEYNKIQTELSDVKLVGTNKRVEELRMIKHDEEIAHIRTACTLTDQCFTATLPKLIEGVTEKEIVWEIESYIRKNGADLAFSPIVAFGSSSSQPHYQLTENRKLATPTLILLDFGARVNGYCSDMTRVVFLGKPKDEWKRAYTTVCDAQKAALDYLSSTKNPSGAKADEVAKDIIAKADFPPYPHSLGHNVGLDIHEAPRLSVKNDTLIKPGMVFSVEPGIYMENQFGIRIEDLVLLKKDGTELLSHAPKELIVL